jgi:hypothetical protein
MEIMTDTGGNKSNAFARLRAALIEDILAASDESILAEAKQDGLDPEVVAHDLRALFEETLAAGNKAALATAKAAVAADRRRSATIIPLEPASARQRLARLFVQHPNEAKTLTMAARKGGSGDFTDEEVQGLLEDFEELGLSAPEEPDSEQ